ncbi:SpoVR family protein [Halolamina sp. CBA1230]|uniref:SpoVR family protein n=1 Tax=Halolamina sp. CBA1230 TaxID=1853690 RepID=UPI0009A23BC3|nr:SpoVR family protein [Halolamina sp. CBA1230]QKY20295.1 SpoVR family protein [Halolamina sp. CBA1230]
MSNTFRAGDSREAQRVRAALEGPVADARELAEKLGLRPRPVRYWLVSYDEMRGLIAQQGFQTRYPHWRWGMQYKQQERREFAGGRAFEIVNNSEPSHAFLQLSNEFADQKAVITHVEAHSDFFANNRWFGLFSRAPDAARLLARHAETIEEYMTDPEIGRDAVEAFIDHVLTVETAIDQWSAFRPVEDRSNADGEDGPELSREERVTELGLADEITEQVFGEWIDDEATSEAVDRLPDPEYDLLGLLYTFGQQYDDESGGAVAFEEWQQDVLAMLRTESYYFAPQRMTKIMNEGWATYWESVMMSDELFAGTDEFVRYADKQAQVLQSRGLNPYALGNSLWQYVENSANRREVVTQLLQVDGITWRNFHDAVEFEAVLDALEPPAAIAGVDADSLDAVAALDDRYVDEDGLAAAREGEIDATAFPWKLLTYDAMVERHYSLVRPENRSFLADVSRERVEELSRYVLEPDRFDSVDEALATVDKAAGWERMREVRESKNDVTFVDEYLTQEFVDIHGLFAYEYSHRADGFRVSSTDVEAVRNKLLLEFTNFGKPRVSVREINYGNQGELLLAHEYNGIRMDIEQMGDVLERLFELWGRPVNCKTIDKRVTDEAIERAARRRQEPEPEEVGVMLRYDGDGFTVTELDDEAVADIAADDVDYDTTPSNWSN